MKLTPLQRRSIEWLKDRQDRYPLNDDAAEQHRKVATAIRQLGEEPAHHHNGEG